MRREGEDSGGGSIHTADPPLCAGAVSKVRRDGAGGQAFLHAVWSLAATIGGKSGEPGIKASICRGGELRQVRRQRTSRQAFLHSLRQSRRGKACGPISTTPESAESAGGRGGAGSSETCRGEAAWHQDDTR